MKANRTTPTTPKNPVATGEPVACISAQFLRVWNRADREEKAFLGDLVDKWDRLRSHESVEEAAFDSVTEHFGLRVGMPGDEGTAWPGLAQNLSELYRVLRLSRGAVAAAL